MTQQSKTPHKFKNFVKSLGNEHFGRLYLTEFMDIIVYIDIYYYSKN